jgi:four helix bundle protein
MAITHYKDLIVWQKSIDLVDQIYIITKQFPKNEVYALASQMQRSAVSIPSNIAEGQSRNHLG